MKVNAFERKVKCRILLAIGILCGCLFSGCSAPAAAAAPVVPVTPVIATVSSPLPLTTVARVSSTPAPAPTSTPKAQLIPALPAGCPNKHVSVETIEIQSGLIGKKIQAHVVLPPCFDRNLPGGYPVLYLLHGQSYTHDHWLDLGVASVAADSINRGEAKPFVIVLPREEYYLEDLPGSHFGDALVNEVIPWIDDHYPTCTQRSCRALGGISRGAVWAVRLGLTHPELFGATGAHSLPAAPYSEYRLAALIKEINANYPMRFYIDSGVTDTYIREAIAFEALLTKYRLPHTWVLGQGTHNDAYWMSQVSNYLSWYTLGWRSDGNS